MQVKKSISSNTICNGCGFKIKSGYDMLDLGMFGGYKSLRWVKLCRSCVHQAHKMFFNYTPEFQTQTNASSGWMN